MTMLNGTVVRLKRKWNRSLFYLFPPHAPDDSYDDKARKPSNTPNKTSIIAPAVSANPVLLIISAPSLPRLIQSIYQTLFRHARVDAYQILRSHQYAMQHQHALIS